MGLFLLAAGAGVELPPTADVRIARAMLDESKVNKLQHLGRSEVSHGEYYVTPTYVVCSRRPRLISLYFTHSFSMPATRSQTVHPAATNAAGTAGGAGSAATATAREDANDTGIRQRPRHGSRTLTVLNAK